MFYNNYLYYLVGAFIFTGVITLYFDMQMYEMADMKREKKTARFIGWFNIVAGILAVIGNLVYMNWIL